MFIKYWSKKRKLSDTTPRQGGMGSFAWSLLCIYFLMKDTGGAGGEGAVVPCLQEGSRERGGSDVNFRRDVPKDWRSNTRVCPKLKEADRLKVLEYRPTRQRILPFR